MVLALALALALSSGGNVITISYFAACGAPTCVVLTMQISTCSLQGGYLTVKRELALPGPSMRLKKRNEVLRDA
jgi:hypothetical protein